MKLTGSHIGEDFSSLLIFSVSDFTNKRMVLSHAPKGLGVVGHLNNGGILLKLKAEQSMYSPDGTGHVPSQEILGKRSLVGRAVV